MGLDRLTNAFGLLLLIQGAGLVVGPPLTATFANGWAPAAALGPVGGPGLAASFYAAGALLALSGLPPSRPQPVGGGQSCKSAAANNDETASYSARTSECRLHVLSWREIADYGQQQQPMHTPPPTIMSLRRRLRCVDLRCPGYWNRTPESRPVPAHEPPPLEEIESPPVTAVRSRELLNMSSGSWMRPLALFASALPAAALLACVCIAVHYRGEERQPTAVNQRSGGAQRSLEKRIWSVSIAVSCALRLLVAAAYRQEIAARLSATLAGVGQHCGAASLIRGPLWAGLSGAGHSLLGLSAPSYCEDMMYTYFAVAEYAVVYANILFHFTAYYDLGSLPICLVLTREFKFPSCKTASGPGSCRYWASCGSVTAASISAEPVTTAWTFAPNSPCLLFTHSIFVGL
uniref:UNC93-like protein 3 n=1 Tax=Macrostomum lignano TaxID=282301 RepID=A0A1I8FLC0_9PLAT